MNRMNCGKNAQNNKFCYFRYFPMCMYAIDGVHTHIRRSAAKRGRSIFMRHFQRAEEKKVQLIYPLFKTKKYPLSLFISLSYAISNQFGAIMYTYLYRRDVENLKFLFNFMMVNFAIGERICEAPRFRIEYTVCRWRCVCNVRHIHLGVRHSYTRPCLY